MGRKGNTVNPWIAQVFKTKPNEKIVYKTYSISIRPSCGRARTTRARRTFSPTAGDRCLARGTFQIWTLLQPWFL